jgi:diacylglycerol kinase (ATP)
MRAAAIFGLGCSQKSLKPFQIEPTTDWHIGIPAAPDAADVILLFGGDGTIHRHLGHLVALGLPVLIVPSGSGNDFARALGLRCVRDSIVAWRRFCHNVSNIRTIDLGVITPQRAADRASSATAQDRSAPHETGRSNLGPRYFCCVAGVGLDGEVSRRANTLPRWLRRHGGYVLSLASAILRFAPLPMKILTPAKSAFEPMREESAANWDVRSDQPTILAAFANTTTYGGGMKIAPRAQMDDGLLDVCIIGGIDPFKLFCMFPTVYAGHHLRIRQVDYFSAASARIETEHPLDVYADGEFVCRTTVEVGVQRGALRVLTPQLSRC